MTGVDAEALAQPNHVRRLVGVYDARGTLWGEISYALQVVLRGKHCALCDITHGGLREKKEWKACRTQMAVPFDTVHLDEQDPELAAATRGRTPCVVADTGESWEVLLGPDDLAACEGSPRKLVEAVSEAARDRNLDLSVGQAEISAVRES